MVVDVPREMILSIGERGRDVIVAGLSPVNGVITQSNLSVTQQNINHWRSCILTRNKDVRYQDMRHRPFRLCRVWTTDLSSGLLQSQVVLQTILDVEYPINSFRIHR